MANVDTRTTLPPGTPVIEIETDTAREIAAGEFLDLAELSSTVEADFGRAVSQIEAGATESYVLIKITA